MNRKYTKSVTDITKCPIPITKEDVDRRYNVDGESMDVIAASIGSSRQRLARWMEFWCIKRRTGPDAARLKWGQEKRARCPNWRGNEWFCKTNKIWMTYAPDHPKANKGRVPTHVLVAEKSIGRYTNKGEQVHHLNADKTDNHPDNLCVMTVAQHRTIHNVLGVVGIAMIFKSKKAVLSLLNEEQRTFVVEIYTKKTKCISEMSFIC